MNEEQRNKLMKMLASMESQRIELSDKKKVMAKSYNDNINMLKKKIEAIANSLKSDNSDALLMAFEEGELDTLLGCN